MIKYTTNKEMKELDKMLRKRYPSAYVKYQEKNKMAEIKRREKREEENREKII
jgi:predicted transport protein